MMLVRTYVGASAIEGVGVFAAEPIAAGTVIWTLDPAFDRLVPMADYEAATPVLRELLDRYAYPNPDDPGTLVLEADSGRFMNHSDDPNGGFPAEGGGIALRDIAAAEEITCDYGEFYTSFALLPSHGES